MPRLEFVEVTPNVLCVRRPWYLSNSYIVHDDRGVTLVDAGMEPDGSDMIAGLSHLGLTVEEVKWILLTHWHNDHSSGAEAIRSLSGATVVYHANEEAHFSRTAVSGVRGRIADALPEHGPAAALKALVGQSPPRAVTMKEHASHGAIIDSRFRVIETPGHTAGHVSYFYVPDRVLFAGDALAVTRGRLWFMSRFLTEDRGRARDSMLTCALTEADAICPGHRGPLNAKVREHQQVLRRYLEEGRSWPLLS